MSQLIGTHSPDAALPRVFFSHATIDRQWVESVADQARAMEIIPYLAEHDPKPGTSLVEKVKAEIARSSAVIVFLTRSGYDSPFVHQEIAFALALGILVVPLVAPEVAGQDLAMLEGCEYIPFDFDDPTASQVNLTAALHTIARAQNRAARSIPSGSTPSAVRIQAAVEIDGTDALLAALLVGVVLTLVVVALQPPR